MSEMQSTVHPLAPHHIPGYITQPDGGDPLFTVVAVCMVVVLVLVGVAYFKLHSLPEHLGDKYNSTQLQLISVLAILALFTHNNAFWVLALLIAVIRLPDFISPLRSMADSLAKLSGDIDQIKAERTRSATKCDEMKVNAAVDGAAQEMKSASGTEDQGGGSNG